MASKADKRVVMTVDIGGNNVKIMLSSGPERRKAPSGPDMTPRQMVEKVQALAEGWDYDVISIGYPGEVKHDRITLEPHNLGPGWLGFDFGAAFGKPVRLVNDAMMQAIGCYEGGRMLFIGLGTGLGAAMVLENVVQPLEIAHLPYRKGKTFEEYVGAAGLAERGKMKWRESVADVLERLRAALLPDYIVIGGGNAKKLEALPDYCRAGHNDKAFEGGFRLWSDPKLVV